MKAPRLERVGSLVAAALLALLLGADASAADDFKCESDAAVTWKFFETGQERMYRAEPLPGVVVAHILRPAGHGLSVTFEGGPSCIANGPGTQSSLFCSAGKGMPSVTLHFVTGRTAPVVGVCVPKAAS